MPRGFHISDQDLMMSVDGELSARDSRRVESHLEACWSCRIRKQELESAIGEFVHFQCERLGGNVSSDGPRALLKARLAQSTESERRPNLRWFEFIPWRASLAGLAIAAFVMAGVAGSVFLWTSQQQATRAAVVTVPNPNFTPGATVLLSRQEVCREASTKNRAVSKAVQRKVFDEYGIRSADPAAYEVDYLITPALGGADDIHNLWPESNRGKIWNARVKDALEDHLRGLVCSGQLDLATAQHEIADGWIDAYKKYFHTDRPLASLQ